MTKFLVSIVIDMDSMAIDQWCLISDFLENFLAFESKI